MAHFPTFFHYFTLESNTPLHPTRKSNDQRSIRNLSRKNCLSGLKAHRCDFLKGFGICTKYLLPNWKYMVNNSLPATLYLTSLFYLPPVSNLLERCAYLIWSNFFCIFCANILNKLCRRTYTFRKVLDISPTDKRINENITLAGTFTY